MQKSLAQSLNLLHPVHTVTARSLTEVLEVGHSLVRRTSIDDLAFVHEGKVVKEAEDREPGLVDGEDDCFSFPGQSAIRVENCVGGSIDMPYLPSILT